MVGLGRINHEIVHREQGHEREDDDRTSRKKIGSTASQLYRRTLVCSALVAILVCEARRDC